MTRTLEQYQLTEKEKQDPLAAQHSAHGSFEGCIPADQRGCTDIFFLLLLIACWICMTCVGANCIAHGNVARLTNPINDQGQVCGSTPAVENQPYFYTVLTSGAGVCTSACPTVNSSLTSTSVNDYFCLNSVMSWELTNTQLSTYIQTFCFANGQFNFQSNCGCMLSLQSKSQFNRCTLIAQEYRSQFATQLVKDYLINFVGDVYKARGIIFGFGFGLTLFLGFIWMFILHIEWLSTIVIWISIFAVQGLLVVMTGLAYNTGENWKHANPQLHTIEEVHGIQVLSVLLLILSIIWAVGMCCLCKTIGIAIKTVALTAECIEEMPMLVVTPMVQIIGFMVFMIPFLIYVFFIASNGEIVKHKYTMPYPPGVPAVPGVDPPSYTYNTYQPSQEDQEILWFMFFCYLWTTEFIVAMGSLIISIAVSQWYFSKPDERGLINSSSRLNYAYRAALGCHAGTAAFGSLVVAVVEFIRAVILYIEKHSKQAQENPCVKYLFYCIDCCLACAEGCLKFINKNAYIQTAIHGSSFCTAAKEGFFLICRNVLRIGTLHVVAGFALFIGKMAIVVTVSACTYFIFTGIYSKTLFGFAGPFMMVLFLSFTVATIFMDVFRTAVDTMLICYITDEEFHDGNPIYCSASMKQFIAKTEMTENDLHEHNTTSCCQRSWCARCCCCGCASTNEHHETKMATVEHEQPAIAQGHAEGPRLV